jgi:putative two-component system response regulator
MMADAEGKRGKILVVDDEEEVLQLLSSFLGHMGYEVLTANCGRQALDLACRDKPDLIILDIVMPDMAGGDVAATLSQDSATKGIPIIFLTALLTRGEENQLKNAPGKFYLMAKPVVTGELLAKVKEIIGQ